MSADPGLSAALDQIAAGALEWAKHLGTYRAHLILFGFTPDTAETLALQLDERAGLFGPLLEEEP